MQHLLPMSGVKSVSLLRSSHLSAEWQLKTQKSPGSSQISNVMKTEGFNIWKINNNIQVFKKKYIKRNRKRRKPVKSSSGLVPV